MTPFQQKMRSELCYIYPKHSFEIFFLYYILILFAEIGFTPGGSSTFQFTHKNTKKNTMERNTQNITYITYNRRIQNKEFH
jgi:hypothetical protein